MEDKRDNDSSPCEDGLCNKLSVRKRRSTRRTSSYVSASVGGRTTMTAPSDRTKSSNPDSCEEEKLDGRGGFSPILGNIKVKEEYVSSGEEDTSSGQREENVSSVQGEVSFREGEEEVAFSAGDTPSGKKGLRNIEPVQNSTGTQHKRGRDMSKFNIGRSKEISEDLRKQVVEAHKSGKGYKRIAKDLDLHLSTVRKIVYKWKKFSTVATLPRSGRPTKIGAKARRTILKHMRENTRVTAKDLKASLALDNINVHESTIRKTLSKWCSWDFTMEEATTLQQE